MKLAEELYRTYCSAAGLNYGSDETPGFHNLPTVGRDAWEHVARTATKRIATRVIDETVGLLSGLVDNAVAELRERFSK